MCHVTFADFALCCIRQSVSVRFLNFDSDKDFVVGFEFCGAQKDPLPELLVAGAAEFWV